MRRRNGVVAFRVAGSGSGNATSGHCARRFCSSAMRCAMQMGVEKNENVHSTSCTSSFSTCSAREGMKLLPWMMCIASSASRRMTASSASSTPK